MSPVRGAKAVTFDCWNTLLRVPEDRASRAVRAGLIRDALADAGVGVTIEQAHETFGSTIREHDRRWVAGQATLPDHMAEWALADHGVRDRRIAGRLAEALANSGLRLDPLVLPGAVDTVERLAAAGVRRALVCDTGVSPGRVVRRMLDAVGLLHLLEVCVFSDEVGVPKPHARMFLAALDALGTDPADAVHVGDLRRTDVAGARAVGMQTVRITAAADDDSELPEAHAVARSHPELLDLLGHGSPVPIGRGAKAPAESRAEAPT